MKCSNCYVEIEENAKFCYNCGTNVVLQLICPNCSATLVKESKFCSNCGSSVVNQHKEKPSISDNDFLIEYNEDSIEEESKKWYAKYFEYVGHFVDGFAPVMDFKTNHNIAGYVSINIPEKLITFENSYRNHNQSILSYFEINNELPMGTSWAGEFNNGKAFIISKEQVYIINTMGKVIEEGQLAQGYNNNFKDSKAVVVAKHNNDNDYIINFKGSIIRNKKEFIKPLYCKDIARYFDLTNNSKVGLLKISNGKSILKANYSDIREEDCILQDSTKKHVVITQIYNLDGSSSFGCIDLTKGCIFKTKYPMIKILYDVSGDWKDGLLMVYLSKEDGDNNETVYRKAISDITGKILLEYSSYSTTDEFATINGQICIFKRHNNGIDIINLNNKLMMSCPNVIDIKSIGEGYFCITNADEKWAIMDLHQSYTIPFGKFDKLHSNINDGGIHVEKNGMHGFVDVYGKILIPLMYKRINNDYSSDEQLSICVLAKEIPGFYFNINCRNETERGIPAEKYIANEMVKYNKYI